MWIDRKIGRVLESHRKIFPVVLVTGPRQSGKTSLLRHIFPGMRYVSLDDPTEASRAIYSPDEFLSQHSPPVIIDEIQYAPTLLRYIKITADASAKKGRFFLTGSQSFHLMQGVSESLAGRVGIITLMTLDAGEVAGARRRFSLEDYIMKGGFPALHAGSVRDAREWFPSYVATYLERDVRNILNVSSLRDYGRFLRAVALRTGQTLSLSDLARDVGITPNTAKAWLSVLQTSGLVFLLEPYHRNMGKRLVKSPKLYISDTGLACHLLGLSSWKEASRSPLVGALWETYALNQILRAFSNRGIGSPPVWFWRTNYGKEVDFVIERNGGFVAIECKYTSVPSESDAKTIEAFRSAYGQETVRRSLIVCNTPARHPVSARVTADNAVNLDDILFS
jgi:hypothetical protein